MADQDRPIDDLHYKYRSLNLKKGVETSMTRANQLDSRQGNIPHLEDLLLQHAYDKLIPAITINQMKLYAHYCTSTTLLTGPGHDLQLISRVPPCSLKFVDASCSQSYVLPELRAPRATCSQSVVGTDSGWSDGWPEVWIDRPNR